MKLKDKVAIITSAGQGIGEAYARRFAQEGAKVVVADINAEKGGAVAKSIGGNAVFERVDVSSEDDTKRLAKAVHDRFGRIDILINNAAIFYGIDQFNSSFEYLRKIFDVNYFGTWLMCRAVFPYMEQQNSGVVINQSSSAAYMHTNMPMPDGLPSFHYSVTKAAINAMTHFMAGCVGISGIRVNAIAPGPTLTEATKQGVPQDILEMVVNMMMAIKKPLDPEDLAGTAVWLASDDAKMVTGQVIAVDGGMVMLG
jgi:NAD(P)-dependent dehydrogenase (short-subunit alcohol dehydrogenase family)